MAQRHLPILQPHEIAIPSDMFRCDPYSSTMSAETCLKRQLRAKEAVESPPNARPMGDYRLCQKCPVGSEIKKRLPKHRPKMKKVGRARFLAKRGKKAG